MPRYHPLRHICATRLGIQLLRRYGLLNQKDDIDKSILYLTESLLLATPCAALSWLSHNSAIFVILYCISYALYTRSVESKKPEDAIYAAKYLRHLRDPGHPSFAFQRPLVTASLVTTLSLQMRLKASNGVQTMEEMTALTQELLTSDPFSDQTTRATATFARAVGHHRLGHRILELDQDLLNEIIECLQLARMHKPELREVHYYLAEFLFIHHSCTMNDALDEVVSILDELIASSSPGDEFLPECQKLMADIAMLRSISRHPEHSEEAIYRARAFLASSSFEDPLYLTWSHVLERARKNRFENFGPINGLVASSSSDRLPADPVDVAFETLPLQKLLNGIRDFSITDIEGEIKLGRSLSYDPSDLNSSYEFGLVLFEAFKRTKNIDYLNESISTYRQLLEHRLPKYMHIATLFWFINALYVRFLVSPGCSLQDLQEVVELCPQFLDDRVTRLPDQFHCACWWALHAHVMKHPSTSAAYETALSLLQDIAPFSPTLQLQHGTLTALPGFALKMPLAYASYQVENGQLEQAIETLERGRALLWSEMRHLRTSVDQIIDADPDLGHKFAKLNRDLDVLTKSIPPNHTLSMDDAVADDLRAGDEFGSFLRRQRGLLKERDELISQIRTLPGFDRFMTFPLFDTLRSAASSGPVIIVNHAVLRSDILILLHNAPPSLIPTPNDFYDRARELEDKLLISQVKDGLDSKEYDKTLASLLVELYELVGKPVIDKLRQLQVPDHSRVWWCPTSVFCSFPLHAMGPIPSDNGELQYFLDLYICSYTPSLSALIQSRSCDSGSRSSDRPSILLVAQADSSLPTVGGEIKVVQTLKDTTTTSLISEAATSAAVLDGFQHHRFVHFACHGTLEANKPFEAGFELHGEERLTLLKIVRTDLPTAEFAFLSACHTAELTEGSIMDEGLHLAAAVQYSGFRSVVGTMWAMVDEDGRDLAENFYKVLFSDSKREKGTPYHERSAKALQFAVKKLRKKRRITLERWVNFVHYGA